MTKAQKVEQAESIAKLREWIKPGDTVYTILDHVSASGMSRAIRVVLPYVTDRPLSDGRPAIDFIHPNYAIGQALGLRHWKRNGHEQDALVVGGCGMDMGFHLVYSLSQVLYGSGYQCLGKGKCPSAYHSNHRDTLRCEGTREHNEHGIDFGAPCWRPMKRDLQAGWPVLQVPIGDNGETLDYPASCITEDRDHNEIPPMICPTCKGAGSIPNPEGPERFDLVHTDGYALRHRWL